MSQRTEAKQRTREALLDAALVVIAQHGYHGARLDMIAKEAGHTTGAVYASFQGKDDLLAVLIDRETSRFVARIAAAVAEGGGTIEDRTSRAVGAYLDYLEETPEFFAVALELFSRMRQDERLRTLYKDQRTLITTAIALILEEGARATGRELVLPAGQIATVIEALGEGIALRYLGEPDSIVPADYKQVVELIAGSMTRPVNP